MPLLEVDDLHVGFPGPAGMVPVVRGVSFTVDASEAVGLAGESGSGKSQTALAIMGLLRPPGRILSGRVMFDGQDLARATEPELRALRGARLSMVFQDALSGLNPAFSIGTQVMDVIRAHQGGSARAVRDAAVRVLDLVGIPDPAARLAQYPHQFSGGMRQRVLIAMAVACRPKLLIADEPTTALDVTVQAGIVRLLAGLRRELGLGLLFITHNLDLMAQACDRAVILYGGRKLESGPTRTLFADPRQPYTRALLACVPRLTDTPGALKPIEGAPPVPSQLGPGCPFVPRCPVRQPRCAETMPPERSLAGRQVACWAAQ